MDTRFRRGLRTAGLAALTIATAGCWPAVGQGPDRAGYNAFEDRITPSTVDDLEPLWTATVPDAATTGGITGSPVLSDSGVVVSNGAAIYSFGKGNGAYQWTWPGSPGVPGAMADPIADGGRVLVSYGIPVGFGGAWIANASWVDARTGADVATPPAVRVVSRRGTRVTSYSTTGGPAVGIGVYRISVIDEAAPSAGWSGTLLFGSVGSFSAPQPATLGAQRLYYAGTATTSYDPATSTTGVRAYSLTPPAICASPPSNLPVGTIPCALWSTPTSSPPVTSPVIGPGESVLYVGTSTELLALDAADGHVLWSAPLAAAPTAEPAVADGRIYVPIANGQLVVLSTSGAPLWKATLGGNALQPAVAGGVVFVGTDAGDVAAYPAAGCGAATCPSLWRRNVGAPVTGAPAVSAGRLYVGASPDQVVAFALP
jgi:hypothetical protein